MSTRNPPGTGLPRLSAAILFIGGADPGIGLQVVGLGGLGVRPRGYPAGDTADPAWRASQRPLPRGRTLAWRRVHRDRRLGTLAVGNITLRERERTRPAFL